uniref:Uncharacterized protein n=1 Tax=uncultured marine virus TaxID=186617 RepID=A0A0F7L331_9VIRU|nr:hypothetical protein [uncultured marine virus]
MAPPDGMMSRLTRPANRVVRSRCELSFRSSAELTPLESHSGRSTAISSSITLGKKCWFPVRPPIDLVCVLFDSVLHGVSKSDLKRHLVTAIAADPLGPV